MLGRRGPRIPTPGTTASRRSGWGVHDHGTNGRDSIIAGNGDDFINAGGGFDTVRGGLGNDTIFGGAADDQLHGEFGSDSLYGGTDQDLDLNPNDGKDSLYGGYGADSLYGNLFNDAVLDAGGVIFGDGLDTIYLADRNAGNQGAVELTLGSQTLDYLVVGTVFNSLQISSYSTLDIKLTRPAGRLTGVIDGATGGVNLDTSFASASIYLRQAARPVDVTVAGNSSIYVGRGRYQFEPVRTLSVPLSVHGTGPNNALILDDSTADFADGNTIQVTPTTIAGFGRRSPIQVTGTFALQANTSKRGNQVSIDGWPGSVTLTGNTGNDDMTISRVGGALSLSGGPGTNRLTYIVPGNPAQASVAALQAGSNFASIALNNSAWTGPVAWKVSGNGLAVGTRRPWFPDRPAWRCWPARALTPSP